MSKPKIVSVLSRTNQLREAFVVEQEDGRKCFNGSWYRGENTNFYPSKKVLRGPDAVDTYYFKGLTPENLSLTKVHPLLRLVVVLPIM